MSRAPYILARTLKDAHSFARETLGLQRGQYRLVMAPATLTAVRGADLYLVPGYEKRFDRFAMKGALRYTRLNVVEVGDLEAEVPAAPDDLAPAGERLIAISDDEAAAFFSDTTNGDIMVSEGAPVPPEKDEPIEQAEEPAEKKTRRTRRRRCKDCGVLVEPDDVESHAADHAADLVSLGSRP